MSDEYVVEITEPLNPIKCANLMHPYLKKGEPVTPEFCRQLLRSSNHRKIMRDMLTLIDARLEKNPDDYWVYREILYGIFCGRRQIDEIINKTAEITVKYINLEKADKTDRALIADLAKENLSAENMLRVKRLAEKIYQKIPIDIDKVAADMVEQIIENKWGNYIPSLNFSDFWTYFFSMAPFQQTADKHWPIFGVFFGCIFKFLTDQFK